MEEGILKQINSLKGVFLMRSTGELYLIGDFIFEKRSKKSWIFGKAKEIWVITHIVVGTKKIQLEIPATISNVLTILMRDRIRYNVMTKSLKEYKCVIASYDKKRFIKTDETNSSGQ